MNKKVRMWRQVQARKQFFVCMCMQVCVCVYVFADDLHAGLWPDWQSSRPGGGWGKKLTTGSFKSRLARQQHIDQQSACRHKHTVAAFASVCV